jgi:hypothetical protein
MRCSLSIAKLFALVFPAAAWLAHAEEIVRPQVKVIEGGESKATAAEWLQRGVLARLGVHADAIHAGES